MAATTVPATTVDGSILGPVPGVETRSALGWAVSDTLAVAGRNLRGMLRNPGIVVFSTVQPIIFVLMFTYVFGGSIEVPGVDYVNFLIPGIFAQSVTFGAVNTAVGLADDLQKGIIERFRSLPMSRAAVIAGRTIADLTRNLFVIAIMVLVGFAVGFRVQTNALAFAASILVIVMFAFALSWLFVNVGLLVANAETAQAAAFPIIAPLTFASSAFVPVADMPGWLQAFADNQPVTKAVDAVRALCLGGPTAGPVLESLAWSLGIIAVFAPLAVRRYRRLA